MKAAFHTLGCKVNSYETDAMKASLAEAGFEIVPFEEPADVYVVNTCSVTNMADRKSRQMLHRAKALSPSAVIAAVGCYAQAQGEKLLKDEAVDIVIGNDRKGQLAGILKQYFTEAQKLLSVGEIGKTREYEELKADCSEHTRAFLKIEDGCNQFCSYCLIPYVRGRVRSRRPENVLAEAERLAAEGFQEIVLTGIHLGSYGIDLEGDAAERAHYGEPLIALIEKLDQIPGIKRIRLGSLEPRVITEENAKRLAGIGKFCPHFHLSLQSGCDATLKRMNRHYTAEEFYGEMKLLRKYFDRPALTTDVIVGFPGETEEEFTETLRFLEKACFYETHVFRYSRRAGTAADRMPEQVPEKVKAARSAVLLALNEKNKAAFEAARLGEETEILLEEKVRRRGKELWRGHSREYLELFADIPDGASNKIVKVILKEDML